jgi:hypothetical protein
MNAHVFYIKRRELIHLKISASCVEGELMKKINIFIGLFSFVAGMSFYPALAITANLPEAK